MFKLTGELSFENVTLKKNWIWDVLEIRWDDIHVIVLNDKEVHLPTMLIIPFIYKLKVRKLFGKRGSIAHIHHAKSRESFGIIWKVNGSKIHPENENLSVQL